MSASPNRRPNAPAFHAPDREFHVSRETRERYEFEETFFSLTGNVVFANFRAARLFAQCINEKRDVVNHPEQSVRAGELNAMGLMDEILHYVVSRYREERKADVMEEALAYLEDELGEPAIEETLEAFVERFPPIAVYRGELSPEAYLAGETKGVPNRAVALEEMILFWIANENPAAELYLELFDDTILEETTVYSEFPDLLEAFFEEQPPYGPENQSLFEMLRSPSKAAPRSWEDQLEYVRTRWGSLIGTYLYRLLSSLDFLEEEEKAFFGFGPGPAEVYEYAGLGAEPENFSPDSDWMPRVVMIAKNVYVWLDQLSDEHGRAIHRLDQVPDEELDRLQRYGFTALWLIGLWERSQASKRIKQRMGNPDAVASAYAINRYGVSDDLGGEAAFNQLKARAAERGIRMASDMVPNHMGIDSDWVMNHPDWFISLDYSPFPSYSFSGPDLCDDDRVGVYLEDHYYDHSDAAVVFQRRDHWTGDTRYIYHGNDGTQMPWNDTAQLNYLDPEVREAVIQTILDVARRSPIIRFDAAMTLAKRHYQRLWFPEPGTGGDIPSRADFGLTKEQFNARMPEEFWRQVVDRVAEEVPDTLLLAEAFWLMEGYFVRTLGMHRVYNSAFMNMMRDEKNAEYREVMKNTLEFDPEILRRYVNFMNNPDERTAVDQFGKGDKYFGICTMMITVPGLPMFGHGQIEGYAEKYGMEFRRAYWDEEPDPYLVERHQREIFPLIKRRYLFAGVDNFCLYDFFTPGGTVDENVFAYSNRVGDQRAVVLYHNRYADTRGWIRTSAAYAVKDAEGNKTLRQATLSEALGITDDSERFLIFRDVASGLEYIRNCHELVEQGLFAELYAYQSYVFLDFREIQDNEWHHYAQLNDYLKGRGVPSIEEALKELYLEPVHGPFRMLVSAPAFRWLVGHTAADPEAVDVEMLDEAEQKVRDLLSGVEVVLEGEETADGASSEDIAKGIREQIAWALSLPDALAEHAPSEGSETYSDAVEFLSSSWQAQDWTMWSSLFGWLFTHRLGDLVDSENGSEISRGWFDEWLLHKPVTRAMEALNLDAAARQRVLTSIRMLLTYPYWKPQVAELRPEVDPYPVLRRALSTSEVRAYLGVNRYEDILWFNRESFERLLWWMVCLTALQVAPEDGQELIEEVVAVYKLVMRLQKAEELSEYQVEKLLRAARA
ncbi:MAG: alpha-amylase family glycosyl hydrolase [Anaerolineae bacterium]